MHGASLQIQLRLQNTSGQDTLSLRVLTQPFIKFVINLKSKTAEQAVRLYGKIFHAEKELREKFQKNQITEEQYLGLRKQKILP